MIWKQQLVLKSALVTLNNTDNIIMKKFIVFCLMAFMVCSCIEYTPIPTDEMVEVSFTHQMVNAEYGKYYLFHPQRDNSANPPNMSEGEI